MHQLFIMRHGMAHSQAASDEQRPLTKEGEQQAFSIAQKHLSHIEFDYVFVSPYLRAQQSFVQVKAAGIQFHQLNTVSWVTPDVSTKGALDELVALKGENLKVLIVCHQTFAGRLVTQLCEGHERGIHLDTANIAQVQTEVFASQCGHFGGILTV